MGELPDRSIHLMVTSPPYNVGKDYDDDLTHAQFMTLIGNVMRETYRVLVDGGQLKNIKTTSSFVTWKTR